MTTVIEVDLGIRDTLTVVQSPLGSVRNPGMPAWHVMVNGEIKHPDCAPEDVMRALGHYIHSLSHKLRSKE